MNRKYTQLTDAQRYQIKAYLKAGMTKKFITEQLQINRTTLYRELKRNSSKRGIYRASRAQIFLMNVKSDMNVAEPLPKLKN